LKYSLYYKKKFDMQDWVNPDRQLTDKFLEKKWVIRAEAATRSCDKYCVFCSIHKLHESKFQSWDIAKVIEDLKELERKWVKIVNFSDDEWWTDDMKTITTIAEWIIKEKINIEWTISTRVDKIAPENIDNEKQKAILEKIKLLKESWLSKLFLWVESGSDSQLKRYKKDVTVAQNEKAIHILQDLWIQYTAGFITLDFLMNLNELKENVKFLRRTWIYKNITNPFSIMRIHDGTTYKQMLKKEWLLWPISEEPLLYTAEFKDPRIWKIAEVVGRLTNEYYEKVFSIKSKSQSYDNWNISEILNAIREADILILEQLVAQAEMWDIDDDIISMAKDQYISKMDQILV